MITPWTAVSTGRSYSSTLGKVGPWRIDAFLSARLGLPGRDTCAQRLVFVPAGGKRWWGLAGVDGRCEEHRIGQKMHQIFMITFCLCEKTDTQTGWLLHCHCPAQCGARARTTRLARCTVASANSHGMLSRSEACCLHPGGCLFISLHEKRGLLKTEYLLCTHMWRPDYNNSILRDKIRQKIIKLIFYCSEMCLMWQLIWAFSPFSHYFKLIISAGCVNSLWVLAVFLKFRHLFKLTIWILYPLVISTIYPQLMLYS